MKVSFFLNLARFIILSLSFDFIILNTMCFEIFLLKFVFAGTFSDLFGRGACISQF